MANGARSCFVSSCKINHLGINPVSGGRPPSESKMRGVKQAIIGALVHEVAKALMFVALFNLNKRNVENVITIYVKRAISVKGVENGRIILIQPRCAIEE